jgi:hypothetical protein
VSAKVPDGLLYCREFFIKTVSGGWYLGLKLNLDFMFKAIIDREGWSWDEGEDDYHKGAALVAPLNILVWSK